MNRPISSNFHHEVLTVLGDAFQREYFIEGYFLDCADPQGKIAVECDGDAYHYTSSGTLLGSDLLRDRLLEKMGWKVVHIKESEWREASNKVEFLRIKMRNILCSF